MNEAKIHTKVDMKHLKRPARIVEELRVSADGDYAFKVNSQGSSYILKGFRMASVACDNSIENSDRAIQIYQNYFFNKAASSFSQHFVRPLSIDSAVELEPKDCLHIEILFECLSKPLSRLEDTSVEISYNLMRQSANALLLLHNVGKTHLNVSSSTMILEEEKNILKIIDREFVLEESKTEDKSILVKVDDKPRIVNMEYAPPEIVALLAGSEKNSKTKLIPEYVDVYCWAMSLYSFIVKYSERNLADALRQCLGKEKEYKNCLKQIEKEYLFCMMPFTELGTEAFIKKIISKALKYKPKDRLKMKEIVTLMKKFEKSSKIKFSYAKTMIDSNNRLKNILVPQLERKETAERNLEELKKELKESLKSEHTLHNSSSKVKLQCGHEIPKESLAEHALKQFLKKTSYKHSYFCTECKKPSKLASLQLDCGCILTKFGKRVKYVDKEAVDCGKCEKKHLLTASDLCLINDHMSFKITSLMLDEYSKKKNSDFLLSLYEVNFSGMNLKEIAWQVAHTGLSKEIMMSRYPDTQKDMRLVIKAFETNTSIRLINFSANHAIGEMIGDFTGALKVNRTLRELCLSNCRIKNGGASAIAEALENNERIVTLDISFNSVAKEGTIAVCQMLKKNKALLNLNIGGNQIFDEEVPFICGALRANRTLKNLYIGNSMISNNGVGFLIKAIRDNKVLEELYAPYNSATYKPGEPVNGIGKDISKLLKVNKTLTILDVTENPIESESMEDISKALKENTTISKLCLGSTQINDRGIASISEALKKHKSLTALSMRRNSIVSEGGKALGEMLKVNRTVTALDVGDNLVGDEGMRAICEALKVNATLKNLEVPRVGMTKESAGDLAQALKVNRKLVHLDLGYNLIGEEGIGSICEELKTNDELLMLLLNGMNLGDGAAIHIAEMLKSNKKLIHLSLITNNIGNKGAEAIGEALKSNKTLAELNLMQNDMKDDGVIFLAKALKVNSVLEFLHISHNKISNKTVKIVDGILKEIRKSIEEANIRS